jgi:NADH:ubiquinone oxidoreductase subunit F (NADH-binding)
MRANPPILSQAIPAGVRSAQLPAIDSFHHLLGCRLAGRPCEGTACFVARNGLGQPQPRREPGAPHLYCLGRCFEAPASGPARSDPHVQVDAREAVILRHLVRGGARTLAAYRAFGGCRALEMALAAAPGGVLAAVEASELRGRGGAGFPTGRKWRAAAGQAAGPKFIAANAGEGDPGACIDRFLLEDDPFAVLEGMALAAHAVGAERGWIYLRQEYPFAAEHVEAALAEARAAGMLGPRIFGSAFHFDVELCVGQGSYICGEETAMLRAIEGLRPEVMARPPYATERGLFGRPTVVNNVETLAAIPWIVERGGDAYRALGFSRSRGTKVVSLNSLFARPGLYEVEFGVSVRHIVETLGGGLRTGAVKGVLIGGPLAGVIPPELFDTPFGFEELRAIGAGVGHGGVVAFDDATTIAALMRHVFAFGARESCGKCTPCRLGSRRVEEIFARIAADGRAPEADGAEFRDIVSALKWTSLCGHGGGLGEFAESARRHYGKELAACFA